MYIMAPGPSPPKRKKAKKSGFQGMRKSELINLCRKNGIGVSGTKDGLIKRLREAKIKEPK
jgi:hypothetical protein